MSTPRFSVIVPTLNEAEEIGATLARARDAFPADTEWLVVDGGSQDGTVESAAAWARVLPAPPCRGEQLRVGAAEARGSILVFLHADTHLSPGTGEAIERSVAEGAAGGCLRFGFRDRPPGPRYRMLERAIDLRTRWFGTATGDQVLFATREAYDACGGVPGLPLFEDVRFVAALRRTGPFRPLGTVARTSARRWVRDGFLRTVARHLGLRFAHALGADPGWLARRYAGSRTAAGPSRPGDDATARR